MVEKSFRYVRILTKSKINKHGINKLTHSLTHHIYYSITITQENEHDEMDRSKQSRH